MSGWPGINKYRLVCVFDDETAATFSIGTSKACRAVEVARVIRMFRIWPNAQRLLISGPTISDTDYLVNRGPDTTAKPSRAWLTLAVNFGINRVLVGSRVSFDRLVGMPLAYSLKL